MPLIQEYFLNGEPVTMETQQTYFCNGAERQGNPYGPLVYSEEHGWIVEEDPWLTISPHETDGWVVERVGPDGSIWESYTPPTHKTLEEDFFEEDI